MLNCIWDVAGRESLVETDDYEKLLLSGKYFKSPGEAKKANESLEDKSHENEKDTDSTRHNLLSTSPETSDGVGVTANGKGKYGVQRSGRRNRNACAGVSEDVDQGIGAGISSEVMESPNVASTEND